MKRFYHTYYIVELMKSEYLQNKEIIEKVEVKSSLNQKNALNFERILPNFELEDKAITDQQQINLINANMETRLKEKSGISKFQVIQMMMIMKKKKKSNSLLLENIQ